VLRVESQVARSEQLVTSSKNLSILTEQQLRTAIHDESAEEYRIGEDIRTPIALEKPANIRQLWAQALSNRPELKALSLAEQARRKQANVEGAAYLPRLDLLATALHANPNPRIFPQEDKFNTTWEAGAQLTWQLHDIPAAAARKEAALARSNVLAFERKATIDRIQIEVVSAEQSLEEAQLAIGTTSRGLRAAEESYRVRRLLFQNGRATSVELLDAETELTRARLDSLNAHIDARVARARLDYALGKDSRS
jgi:outer membrane protein TolC